MIFDPRGVIDCGEGFENPTLSDERIEWNLSLTLTQQHSRYVENARPLVELDLAKFSSKYFITFCSLYTIIFIALKILTLHFLTFFSTVFVELHTFLRCIIPPPIEK